MNRDSPFRQPTTSPVFVQPDYYVEPEVKDLVRGLQEESDFLEAADLARKRHLSEREGRRRADEEEKAQRRIVAQRGDTVPIQATHWLWRHRFVLGGLSLLAGKGEVSKSTVFAQLAAWITRGDMKGKYYGIPRDVAYVVNEDLVGQTVAPRMVAHDANMSRIHFLTVKSPLGEDALSFPADADLLRDFITETGVVATFIDPLSANVTGNRNDQGNMRMVYQEVSRIAQDTETCIAGLAHTRKEGAHDIVEALMGSSEQANIARSVHGLIMDPDHDGARILSCDKNNLYNRLDLPTLRFELDSVDVPCTDGSALVASQPRIRWLEEISETASDILGDSLFGHDGIDECARWLYDYLMSQGGEATYTTIKEAAGKKFGERMLQRARKKINVASRRHRTVPPTAVWSLPL